MAIEVSLPDGFAGQRSPDPPHRMSLRYLSGDGVSGVCCGPASYSDCCCFSPPPPAGCPVVEPPAVASGPTILGGGGSTGTRHGGLTG